MARYPAIKPGAIEPEALTVLVFDAVIIARLLAALADAAPPFGSDALGTIGCTHAMRPLPPAEKQRRIVGDRRRRLDRLGRGNNRIGRGLAGFQLAVVPSANGGRSAPRVPEYDFRAAPAAQRPHAKAVGKTVDQGAEIGAVAAFIAMKAELRRGERLGAGRGQHHVFDAEAGIDLRQLPEKPPQMPRVARRKRRADGRALDPAVDAIKRQRKLARTDAVFAETPRQMLQQFAQRRRDRFRFAIGSAKSGATSATTAAATATAARLQCQA